MIGLKVLVLGKKHAQRGKQNALSAVPHQTERAANVKAGIDEIKNAPINKAHANLFINATSGTMVR